MREKPRPPAGVGIGLAAVVIVLAAILTVVLTLPLLSRSLAAFAVAAGCAWAAIFAGATALTRSLTRGDAESSGGETVAERPERILDDALPDAVRIDGFARRATHLEEHSD